jgi:SH3-like domain-containing protein
VWGLVNAGEYKGAIIRPEPGSNDQVTSLLNGAVLQILPEIVNKGGIIWLHVRTPDGKEGWVQASLIVTATPAPR